MECQGTWQIGRKENYNLASRIWIMDRERETRAWNEKDSAVNKIFLHEPKDTVKFK